MGLLMNLAYAVYHVRSQDILAYLCTPDGICVSIIILHVKYVYCITPSVHQVTGDQSHMYHCATQYAHLMGYVCVQ